MATVASDLLKDMDVSFESLEKIELKYNENSLFIANLIFENEELHRQYEDGVRKMQEMTSPRLKDLFLSHEKTLSCMRAEEKELMEREVELRKQEAAILKQEALNRKERQELDQQNKMILENEKAVEEQKEASKHLVKLAEENLSTLEKLHMRINALEMKNVENHALKMEVQRLNMAVQIQTHKGVGVDIGKKKLVEIQLKLKEISEDLEIMESLNNTLVSRERICHDEVKNARGELIQGLEMNPSGASVIGVRRMACIGELAADNEATRACLDLGYPMWHPFKVKTVNGKVEEEVDHEDEKLKIVKRLKTKGSNMFYYEVVSALEELNEYFGSKPLLWNFKKSRKATLKEGVSHLMNEWKRSRSS